MSTNTATTHASPAKAAAAIIASVVGLGLASLQTTSLMEGTGKIWAGVAVAAAGIVIALLGGVNKRALVVAIILTGLAFVSAAYMEHQVDQRRMEVVNDLDQLSSYDRT